MDDPLLLGLEIGGTKLQLGLGHGDGRLPALARLAVRPEAGAAGIRAQIAEALDPLLGQLGASRADLRAVGIGFGGPVDASAGRVLTSHQIRGWEGFPLAAWVRDQLGDDPRPVVLHNDADTAALGEARFGAGVGCSPVLYVTIGSGIGGGLIVDGSIYRGGSGSGALEIGHLWIRGLDGPSPDSPRTLEQVASGWSIGRRARLLMEEALSAGRPPTVLLRLAGGDPARITAETVARAAEQGDRLAQAVLTEASSAVAQALAHAVTLLAPQRIILGGGVSLIGEGLWFGPIRRQLDRLVFPPFRPSFDLVPTALGEAVVVHGALALARALVAPSSHQ